MDFRPNNHEEEQEGINAERKDQEGLKGSNALSKQKRQNTSYPSVTDTTPPHIVVEMQMMKERMNFFMMTALKGQVLNDLNELVHQIDSPFTAPVTSFPLPTKFRLS